MTVISTEMLPLTPATMMATMMELVILARTLPIVAFMIMLIMMVIIVSMIQKFLLC